MRPPQALQLLDGCSQQKPDMVKCSRWDLRCTVALECTASQHEPSVNNQPRQNEKVVRVMQVGGDNEVKRQHGRHSAMIKDK